VFLGEYEHSMDTKGRVAIPARFRDDLQEGFILTRGFETCLQGFPKPIWQTLSQRISASALGSEEARNLRRLLFSGAAEAEMDRQGRVLIPQNLREYAALNERVIVVGLNTYLEIWSYEQWQNILGTLNSSAGVIAEHLSDMGV
jgi:MraZ protein